MAFFLLDKPRTSEEKQTMLVVMEADVDSNQQKVVLDVMTQRGYRPVPTVGPDRIIITALGDDPSKDTLQALASLPGVEKVTPIALPYKLACRVEHRERTTITVRDIAIGGPDVVVMAGPCTVESAEQVAEAGRAVHAAGAQILRGGAFKPRTSPYSFQGMAEAGLQIMHDIGRTLHMPVVTECMSTEEVDLVAAYADIVQIGARNAQNFSLLKRVGQIDKPVLLKRGMSTTIEEFLLAAEYVLAAGNPQVILCERGIRTFENATRHTLDLSAIPVLRQASHLPVVVDPSHATGHWAYVTPMAKAAIAAGADGLLIEVHPHPEQALCDGAQSLKPSTFNTLMQDLTHIAHAVRRRMGARIYDL
jgi:3-deoxy-7-phosphoheptulonate synthase